MTMKLPRNICRVLDSVLGAEGRAAQPLRLAAADRAAAAGGARRSNTAVPEAVQPYVDKLIETPWKVVDRDIGTLVGEGMTEDEIFELTVATALGSAIGRYEKALALLGDDDS